MKRLSKNKSIEEEGRVMGGRSLENGVNSEGGEIGDSNYEEEKPGVCAGKSSDRNSNTDSEPLPVNSQFISNPHILLFNHISDSTPKIISCSEGSIRNNQTFTDLDQKTHKIKDLRKLSSSAKDETLFPICSGKQPRIHSTLYQALIPRNMEDKTGVEPNFIEDNPDSERGRIRNFDNIEEKIEDIEHRSVFCLDSLSPQQIDEYLEFANSLINDHTYTQHAGPLLLGGCQFEEQTLNLLKTCGYSINKAKFALIYPTIYQTERNKVNELPEGELEAIVKSGVNDLLGFKKEEQQNLITKLNEMINEKIHIDDLNEYLQMLEKYNCKIPEEVQKSISDSLQFSKILKKKFTKKIELEELEELHTATKTHKIITNEMKSISDHIEKAKKWLKKSENISEKWISMKHLQNLVNEAKCIPVKFKHYSSIKQRYNGAHTCLTKIYNLIRTSKTRTGSNNDKCHESNIIQILKEATRYKFINNDIIKQREYLSEIEEWKNRVYMLMEDERTPPTVELYQTLLNDTVTFKYRVDLIANLQHLLNSFDWSNRIHQALVNGVKLSNFITLLNEGVVNSYKMSYGLDLEILKEYVISIQEYQQEVSNWLSNKDDNTIHPKNVTKPNKFGIKTNKMEKQESGLISLEELEKLERKGQLFTLKVKEKDMIHEKVEEIRIWREKLNNFNSKEEQDITLEEINIINKESLEIKILVPEFDVFSDKIKPSLSWLNRVSKFLKKLEREKKTKNDKDCGDNHKTGEVGSVNNSPLKIEGLKRMESEEAGSSCLVVNDFPLNEFSTPLSSSSVNAKNKKSPNNITLNIEEQIKEKYEEELNHSHVLIQNKIENIQQKIEKKPCLYKFLESFLETSNEIVKKTSEYAELISILNESIEWDNYSQQLIEAYKLIGSQSLLSSANLHKNEEEPAEDTLKEKNEEGNGEMMDMEFEIIIEEDQICKEDLDERREGKVAEMKEQELISEIENQLSMFNYIVCKKSTLLELHNILLIKNWIMKAKEVLNTLTLHEQRKTQTQSPAHASFNTSGVSSPALSITAAASNNIEKNLKLNTIEALMREYTHYNFSLHSTCLALYQELQGKLQEGKKWMAMYREIITDTYTQQQANTNLQTTNAQTPTLQTIQNLIAAGEALPIHLKQLQFLKQLSANLILLQHKSKYALTHQITFSQLGHILQQFHDFPHHSPTILIPEFKLVNALYNAAYQWTTLAEALLNKRVLATLVFKDNKNNQSYFQTPNSSEFENLNEVDKECNYLDEFEHTEATDVTDVSHKIGSKQKFKKVELSIILRKKSLEFKKEEETLKTNFQKAIQAAGVEMEIQKDENKQIAENNLNLEISPTPSDMLVITTPIQKNPNEVFLTPNEKTKNTLNISPFAKDDQTHYEFCSIRLSTKPSKARRCTKSKPELPTALQTSIPIPSKSHHETSKPSTCTPPSINLQTSPELPHSSQPSFPDTLTQDSAEKLKKQRTFNQMHNPSLLQSEASLNGENTLGSPSTPPNAQSHIKTSKRVKKLSAKMKEYEETERELSLIKKINLHKKKKLANYIEPSPNPSPQKKHIPNMHAEVSSPSAALQQFSPFFTHTQNQSLNQHTIPNTHSAAAGACAAGAGSASYPSLLQKLSPVTPQKLSKLSAPERSKLLLQRYSFPNSEYSGNVYCICRRADDQLCFMIACDNCNEWFHSQCIHLPKAFLANSSAYPRNSSRNSFMCIGCARRKSLPPLPAFSNPAAPSNSGNANVNASSSTANTGNSNTFAAFQSYHLPFLSTQRPAEHNLHELIIQGDRFPLTLDHQMQQLYQIRERIVQWRMWCSLEIQKGVCIEELENVCKKKIRNHKEYLKRSLDRDLFLFQLYLESESFPVIAEEGEKVLLILKQRDWTREAFKSIYFKTTIRYTKKLVTNAEKLQINQNPELAPLLNQIQQLCSNTENSSERLGDILNQRSRREDLASLLELTDKLNVHTEKFDNAKKLLKDFDTLVNKIWNAIMKKNTSFGVLEQYQKEGERYNLIDNRIIELNKIVYNGREWIVKCQEALKLRSETFNEIRTKADNIASLLKMYEKIPTHIPLVSHLEMELELLEGKLKLNQHPEETELNGFDFEYKTLTYNGEKPVEYYQQPLYSAKKENEYSIQIEQAAFGGDDHSQKDKEYFHQFYLPPSQSNQNNQYS